MSKREIQKEDFDIHQGNSGTIRDPRGIVIDYVEEATGTPIDLTGWDIVFTAKRNSQKITRSLSSGNLIVDAPQGSITVPISTTFSRAWGAGDNVEYEIEIRRGDEQRSILKGLLRIHKGVNDD